MSKSFSRGVLVKKLKLKEGSKVDKDIECSGYQLSIMAKGLEGGQLSILCS